jgi:hypothetical protein
MWRCPPRPEFGTVAALTLSEVPAEARRSVREHYRKLTRPLTDAITTRLALGVIGVAIGHIRDGQDPATVSAETLSFLVAALGHEPDIEG